MSHEENAVDGLTNESELENTGVETESVKEPEPVAPKKKKDKTVPKKTAPKKAEPKAKAAPAPKAAPVVKAALKAAPKKNGVISGENMAEARANAEKFKMLGDATRISIISLCSDGEIHVGAICEAVGQSQPAISHHLALLRHSGIVQSRRDGKNNFYSLTETGDRLANVLSTF